VTPLDEVTLGVAHVEGHEQVGPIVRRLAHQSKGARGALLDLGELVRVVWAVVEAAGMRAEDEDVTAILLVEVDLEHLALRTLPPLLLQVWVRVRVRARVGVRVRARVRVRVRVSPSCCRL